MKDNKTILITGSSGFIGHHLLQRLSKKYKNVIPVARDLLYVPTYLRKFLELWNPDYIFHLAAYGNHYFQTEEDVIFKANNVALANLLDASRELNFKGLFNFSTTHHNLEAGSFYGATKAGGEYLVRAYVRNFNKPIINIRPYSVFGEYEWNFRFIPTICRQIKNGEPVTVSDVSHDWIYIEDFLDGLEEAVINIPGLRGESVGIGTGMRISNRELASIVMDTVGKRVGVLTGQMREYEIAAYGKEILQSKEKNEIEYFQFAKTPLPTALRRVYDSSEIWLNRNK